MPDQSGARTLFVDSSLIQTYTCGFSTGSSQRLSFDDVKPLLFFYLVWTNSLKLYRHLYARGVVSTVPDTYKWVAQQWPPQVIFIALRMPQMKKKVETMMVTSKIQIEGMVKPRSEPRKTERMDSEMGNEVKRRVGKLSGAVYHSGLRCGGNHEIIVAAFQWYGVSISLHPDVFLAARTMEAEIVPMYVRIYNNLNGAGATTFGGTEIDKAANYFKIKLHSISVVLFTRRVDLKRVKRGHLVGFAIDFPDGNIDPISELGTPAKKHDIGLHADCCLGLLIMPFLEEAGLREFPDFAASGKKKKVPLFDFRVPEVASIRCDTHKISSMGLRLRNAELRQHQYYINSAWMDPDFLIAGTWGAAQYMGRAGYLAALPKVNVFEIGDKRSKKGSHLTGLMNPGLSFVVLPRNRARLLSRDDKLKATTLCGSAWLLLIRLEDGSFWRLDQVHLIVKLGVPSDWVQCSLDGVPAGRGTLEISAVDQSSLTVMSSDTYSITEVAGLIQAQMAKAWHSYVLLVLCLVYGVVSQFQWLISSNLIRDAEDGRARPFIWNLGNSSSCSVPLGQTVEGHESAVRGAQAKRKREVRHGSEFVRAILRWHSGNYPAIRLHIILLTYLILPRIKGQRKPTCGQASSRIIELATIDTDPEHLEKPTICFCKWIEILPSTKSDRRSNPPEKEISSTRTEEVQWTKWSTSSAWSSPVAIVNSR
ncbi:PLP-dependent transferase [Neolentinus lepideus HHB14362 ss-1]|uniref:PLP-dependent transferase n=1 Tax=Neolentinus lepideus HHB14362 ss-1 TaxID=1314782 RepID=A0A165V3L3_9AGAM|nr:PLP-dependent transferase [Neolentinus lepideus HHB14362 ss-1]